ncbi:hypothetical protein Celaphus_00009805 [Cervus elaphus hippelaphus]|uniref:Uncharacterized protein n=1 Tax=Cervus elaphus hippelaphus TaxID=46360 RepID=A0A212C080_CEREH|nr:hypothetical protein Celaphus_00009805 [Cervus elaphus hippelaphus]
MAAAEGRRAWQKGRERWL